jgi:hypothetical protein
MFRNLRKKEAGQGITEFVLVIAAFTSLLSAAAHYASMILSAIGL